MTRKFQLGNDFNLFVDSNRITIEFDGDPVRPVSIAGVTLDRTQTRVLIDWLTAHFGPPWVSVEDALPEDGEAVDVWIVGKVKEYFLEDVRYDKTNGFKTANHGIELHDTTHWMPRRKMEAPR